MVFLLLVNLSTWTARYVPWGCQNICTSAHHRHALFSPASLLPHENSPAQPSRPPEAATDLELLDPGAFVMTVAQHMGPAHTSYV